MPCEVPTSVPRQDLLPRSPGQASPSGRCLVARGGSAGTRRSPPQTAQTGGWMHDHRQRGMERNFQVFQLSYFILPRHVQACICSYLQTLLLVAQLTRHTFAYMSVCKRTSSSAIIKCGFCSSLSKCHFSSLRRVINRLKRISLLWIFSILPAGSKAVLLID